MSVKFVRGATTKGSGDKTNTSFGNAISSSGPNDTLNCFYRIPRKSKRGGNQACERNDKPQRYHSKERIEK
ncbi:hypothetical protein AGABI2DRAFT_135916 [Agaricus bisporus var. bisporus H97]|uniref:hypothetical protein n=1 Tax=Agaricus bisporus var. bisporus (strain H97 / ATCC MYA-4626 / FGSC 10389) TaxID=936046 RepID=UPI00029F7A49|nr:hypothetical protein AGABI2DRAFT_135916 [Agaricus bisporus var. bisporus H97]EKV47166.1 hypothetical protein AGABI2DRAFT_135916 [Agaricus bisporus var. bisporus H97]